MFNVATGLLVLISPSSANTSNTSANDEGIIVDLEEKPDKLTLASIILANGNDIKYTRLQELYHQRFGHDLSCRRLCAALGASEHIRNPILALRSAGGLFTIRLLSADFTIHVSEEALAAAVSGGEGEGDCSLNSLSAVGGTTGAQLSPSLFVGVNLPAPDNVKSFTDSDVKMVKSNNNNAEAENNKSVGESSDVKSDDASITEPEPVAMVESGSSSAAETDSKQSFSKASYENIANDDGELNKKTTVVVFPTAAVTVPMQATSTVIPNFPAKATTTVNKPVTTNADTASLTVTAETTIGAATNSVDINETRLSSEKPPSTWAGEAFAVVKTSPPFAGVGRLNLRVVPDTAVDVEFDCCKTPQVARITRALTKTSNSFHQLL